jgi:hypothetical protein
VKQSQFDHYGMCLIFGKGIEAHIGGNHVEKRKEQDDDDPIGRENEIVLGEVVDAVGLGHCGVWASQSEGTDNELGA